MKIEISQIQCILEIKAITESEIPSEHLSL